jgi:hypothetical protein
LRSLFSEGDHQCFPNDNGQHVYVENDHVKKREYTQNIKIRTTYHYNSCARFPSLSCLVYLISTYHSKSFDYMGHSLLAFEHQRTNKSRSNKMDSRHIATPSSDNSPWCPIYQESCKVVVALVSSIAWMQTHPIRFYLRT